MLPSATATTHPPPAGIVPAIVSLSVYLIYDLIPAYSKTSSAPLQCIPFLLTFDVRMMVEDQSPLNEEATAYCALILEECFLLSATTHSSTACKATRRTSNPPLSNPSTSILAACYTQGHSAALASLFYTEILYKPPSRRHVGFDCRRNCNTRRQHETL